MKFPKILTIFLIVLISTLILINPIMPATKTLTLKVLTEKKSYYIGEEAAVSGNVLTDGIPTSDAVVTLEILNSRGTPLIYRTLIIGNPIIRWPLEIRGALLKDSSGNQIDSVKIESTVNLYVTVFNTMLNEVSTTATITVFDANDVPIFAGWQKFSIPANNLRTTSWSIYTPEWVKPGKASVFINLFDDFPRNGGTPQTPENLFQFYITRNQMLKYPYSTPETTCFTSSGFYKIIFKIPPDRYTLPGNYSVYASVMLDPLTKTYTSTTFNLQSYPCPPQASFTYYPLEVYQNMTVTFDASSSSAEGYNDTIIKYEWIINDPYNPDHIINAGNFTNPPSPLAYHKFPYPGIYTVELNVTDNEGLWSTTSKPINILPEYGPKANFTWKPLTPNLNQTVTFDASTSTPGWSAEIADYAPIANYAWNFSDGTPLFITTNATANHIFTQPGNYTVTLTITDSVNRTDSLTQTVEVLNITAKLYDLNGDNKIDMRDIAIAARAFGSQPGDSNWNPVADVNGDGKVDMKDIAPIARNFGKDP